jgi:hypothetical protein
MGLSLIALFRSVATIEKGRVGRSKRRSAWIQIGLVSAGIAAAAIWSAL